MCLWLGESRQTHYCGLNNGHCQRAAGSNGFFWIPGYCRRMVMCSRWKFLAGTSPPLHGFNAIQQSTLFFCVFLLSFSWCMDIFSFFIIDFCWGLVHENWKVIWVLIYRTEAFRTSVMKTSGTWFSTWSMPLFPLLIHSWTIYSSLSYLICVKWEELSNSGQKIIQSLVKLATPGPVIGDQMWLRCACKSSV